MRSDNRRNRRSTSAWTLTLALLGAACGGSGEPVGTSSGGASGSAGVAGAAGGAGTAGTAGSNPGVDPCALWTASEGSELDQTLPNLALQVLADGGEQDRRLHEFRASCERPGLLVVHVEPAWCAPCGMRHDRFAKLLELFPADAIDAVTLLYAGPDNARPTPGDLVAWKTIHPTVPGIFARSGDGAASALVSRTHVVPMVFLVDRRTLRISNALESPSDTFFVDQVVASLQDVGGPAVTPTVGPQPPQVDQRFDEADWQIIQQMVAPLVPPPSPSNKHADDPAAAALGAKLFDDTMLAGKGGLACATCHRKDKGFADGLPTAKGVEVGSINTPAIDTAAWNRWQFWDGRADSLWSQALGPLENPAETGGSRLHVAHRVQQAYAADYEALFGPLPPLGDLQRFPAEGKPGDAAYDAMSEADREAVTRVFANVGKAIEAFERTLRPPPTRLEAYVAGDYEVLTPLERNGLKGFLHSGCISCHHGPTLSDGAFHNILMPAHSATGPADRGRIDGVTKLLASPFRADGPFSDDPTTGARLKALAASDEMLGQFKTPSLRGITRNGPWGHGGTFATLDEVVKHYGQVKAEELQGPRAAGDQDPTVAKFLGGHNAELVAFLKVLGGE